jgi:pyruvate dehydrogenase E1 component alpha subunit
MSKIKKSVVATDQKPLLPNDVLVDLYRRMLSVRFFEDKVHESFQEGLVFGTTHLCQGQEAVSAGATANLIDGDFLTYTYRGHGQCIARGMDMEGAFAEIFGRSTGVSGGLGGSMHLTDMDLGLIGSFAIVGAGVPVAAGAAMTCQYEDKGNVAMTFFGDGSTNIGAFHETMNLASIWNLPLLFICENNLYGEYSPILSTTPYQDLIRRAEAYAMPAEIVDGNDAQAVYRVIGEYVARARNGGGPAFIECKTYRYKGHSRSDPAKYRPDGELDAWLAKDPIKSMSRFLVEHKVLSEDEVEAISQEILEHANAAVKRAADAPFPEISDLTDATYATTSINSGDINANNL